MPETQFPHVNLATRTPQTVGQRAYALADLDLGAAFALRLGIPLAPSKPKPAARRHLNRAARRARQARETVLNSYSRTLTARAAS